MNIFGTIKGKRTKRSKFNLSHERKLSLNMGELIPILTEEIVPGDKFKVNSEIMMRLAPMIAPIMHRVNVYTHYFFVPNRLVWNEWESFITGGRQGDELPAYPQLPVNGTSRAQLGKGSLYDYFGLPIPAEGAIQQREVSALPFRAYQTIFNEYYQDQNLSTPVGITKDSGLIGSGSQEFTDTVTMRKRAWEKDYFTSALPWAQRGGEATIPGSANYKQEALILDANGDPVNPVGNEAFITDQGHLTATSATGDPYGIDNLESLDITVNDLRRSVRLQEWLERTARGGSRYIEQILSHFGVHSSDKRLQRPEYLGGGKNPVVISEVLNTAGDPQGQAAAAVGEMAGHGISVGNNFAFNKHFEEHGYVIGIMSVLPRTTYQQGIHKHWLRRDKLDYYWPEFANLGEQEVSGEELYVDWENPKDEAGTFGYQSRYAEMKYCNSSVHGDFRDTLDFWHMGRKFENKPQLNEEFITSDPTQRIFAVTDPDEDKLYCQVFNNVSALRPMPYFGTPRL